MKCEFANMEEAYATLDKLMAAPSIVNNGVRTPFWVFTHLAQSTNYSMTGYPELRPKWLRMTIGKLVFTLFYLTGRMHHNLAEPIPGAPIIPEEGDWRSAIEKFKQTLQKFQAYDGVLAPHFMYGDLNKKEFTRAHLMHLANHLELIEELSS